MVRRDHHLPTGILSEVIEDTASLSNCIRVQTEFRLVYEQKVGTRLCLLPVFGDNTQNRPQQRSSGPTALQFQRASVSVFPSYQKAVARKQFYFLCCGRYRFKRDYMFSKDARNHLRQFIFEFFDIHACM
ncbi:hypothetical protein TSH7_16830 [Azospirillum sp. TSH7]|nr:hypothetical protein TSH20_30000 [Azospirillum sp. TSH20]PWC61479.1 hypothetical protein TSH7_16830 [Azospirillum sp. TSH7]